MFLFLKAVAAEIIRVEVRSRNGCQHVTIGLPTAWRFVMPCLCIRRRLRSLTLAKIRAAATKNIIWQWTLPRDRYYSDGLHCGFIGYLLCPRSHLPSVFEAPTWWYQTRASWGLRLVEVRTSAKRFSHFSSRTAFWFAGLRWWRGQRSRTRHWPPEPWVRLTGGASFTNDYTG